MHMCMIIYAYVDDLIMHDVDDDLSMLMSLCILCINVYDVVCDECLVLYVIIMYLTIYFAGGDTCVV